MGLSERSELGTGLNRPPFGIRIDRSAEDLVVFFFVSLVFFARVGSGFVAGLLSDPFPDLAWIRFWR